MTQTNKKFIMRFAVVALVVGMLSPSVSIENGTAEVSMFNAAQAKQKVKHKNVKHNKNVNRNVKHNKNVNVNHNGGKHYNNQHNDHTAAKVLGGMAVGAAIVKATDSSDEK